MSHPREIARAIVEDWYKGRHPKSHIIALDLYNNPPQSLTERIARAITEEREHVGVIKEDAMDMVRFAELAQDFYALKQQEAGMVTPIRKAWASNEAGGMLIIVSCFGVHSRQLAEQVGIPWKKS